MHHTISSCLSPTPRCCLAGSRNQAKKRQTRIMPCKRARHGSPNPITTRIHHQTLTTNRTLTFACDTVGHGKVRHSRRQALPARAQTWRNHAIIFGRHLSGAPEACAPSSDRSLLPFAVRSLTWRVRISLSLAPREEIPTRSIVPFSGNALHVQSSGAVCESRGGRPGLPSLINLRFLWT